MRKISPRHLARETALQAIYQWQMNHGHYTELRDQFFESGFEHPIDEPYFSDLLQGVIENIDIINDTLTPFLDGKKLTELNPVELAAVRIAVYELLYHFEVPYRVVINEALECTKTFGAEEGFRFVNGILDQVAKKVRHSEINPS